MQIDLLRDKHTQIRLHSPMCSSNTQFTTQVSLCTNIRSFRDQTVTTIFKYTLLTSFQTSLICGFLKFQAHKDPI